MIRWKELTPEQRDELILEKVCGYAVSQVKGRWPIPCYSQDIKAAWLLVEYLRNKHLDVHIASQALLFYDVLIMDRRLEGPKFEASAPTAPEAICIAALRSCGCEVIN